MVARLLEGPGAGGVMLLLCSCTPCLNSCSRGLTAAVAQPASCQRDVLSAGMLQREGPAGLTTLHAAVLGGAVAALPLLVAEADDIAACLDFEDGGADLSQLLSRFPTRWPHLDNGSTALALAVKCGGELRVSRDCWFGEIEPELAATQLQRGNIRQRN